ncbi:MAG: 23S rRNA (guanosine(2251)-2'-O)-methyltransferase RlmB [Clostridia bacterium]|nr:23S rRNA (guanosine(2251)-2'-O)-methyltransferase RlmB [Clostridia bacterium]
MNFEGKNAVFELIGSNKTIEKICIQDKTTDQKLREIVSLAQDKHVKLEFISKQALDKISETGHHQGVIAVATDFVYADLDGVVESKRKEGRRVLLVLLDNVVDPHNLGSIIRVCECAGVTAVVIPKNRSAVVNETVARISAGALAHLPVCKVTNMAQTIKELKAKNIWVYSADMDGTPMYETDLSGDIALIVGSEGFGVSPLIKKESDGVVSIPMFGKVNSLNASISAGIVVYEAVRQQLNKE